MSKRAQVHVPLDVKLVAKIALSVAFASGVSLLLVLLALSDERGLGYGQIIGAFGFAKESLGPAMLVSGLGIVGIAGISAWLFSLYASFRIAGPLYRISRDLELQIEGGSIAPMSIRLSDGLQGEWQEFAASVAALRMQQEQLRQALATVEKALQASTAGTIATSLALALAGLKEAERRVRF